MGSMLIFEASLRRKKGDSAIATRILADEMPRQHHAFTCRGAGFTGAATVATTRGMFPVADLVPGDRIITWEGSRALTEVRTETSDRELVGIPPGFFGSGELVWVDPDQHLMLHGVTLRNAIGLRAAMVRAGHLTFLPFVQTRWAGSFASSGTAPTPLYCLCIDQPGAVNVGGLWLATCSCAHPPKPKAVVGDPRIPLLGEREVRVILKGMAL
jgi:hypothetical protein